MNVHSGFRVHDRPCHELVCQPLQPALVMKARIWIHRAAGANVAARYFWEVFHRTCPHQEQSVSERAFFFQFFFPFFVPASYRATTPPGSHRELVVLRRVAEASQMVQPTEHPCERSCFRCVTWSGFPSQSFARAGRRDVNAIYDLSDTRVVHKTCVRDCTHSFQMTSMT